MQAAAVRPTKRVSKERCIFSPEQWREWTQICTSAVEFAPWKSRLWQNFLIPYKSDFLTWQITYCDCLNLQLLIQRYRKMFGHWPIAYDDTSLAIPPIVSRGYNNRLHPIITVADCDKTVYRKLNNGSHGLVVLAGNCDNGGGGRGGV